VPICLPPFTPVRPEDIDPNMKEEPEDDQAGPGFLGAREFVLNATARIPFEDLDCFMAGGGVPYPHKGIPDVDQGYLSCHPMGMINSLDINIAGRTSFITAYGSTSREAGPGGDRSLRYLCRTNAYGPKESIFHDCHGKCHKRITNPYKIENTKSRSSNPSLHNKICQEFLSSVVNTGTMEKDFKAEQHGGKIKNLLPAKVLLTGSAGPLECYPYSSHEAAAKVQSMYDFPYKYGWCSVCERKGVNNSSDCADLLSSDHNWGWCLPECEEDWLQPDWHKYAHEAVVDSFVYENCSHGVDTFTEFCTGSKLLTAYTMEYQYSQGDNKNRFQFIKGNFRDYHPWDKEWNNKGRNIRPGARYQGSQHTQAEGDVCYGDAGGSVWKLWSFRDLSNKNKEDNTVRRPAWGRLAVLTGVISRFEKHCGFYRPDSSEGMSRPVQHSVHARVSMYMRWIGATIQDGGQCSP